MEASLKFIFNLSLALSKYQLITFKQILLKKINSGFFFCYFRSAISRQRYRSDFPVSGDNFIKHFYNL